MANPSLYYLPHLLQEIKDEYQDWVNHPEQNGDFLPKRMGLRIGYKDISVTDYEKVLATNRPLPKLDGMSCVVRRDYAELSDWAASTCISGAATSAMTSITLGCACNRKRCHVSSRRGGNGKSRDI